MPDALPDNPQGRTLPEPDKPAPVSTPNQGSAPAWVDPSDDEQPLFGEQPALDAGPDRSVRGLTLERGGRSGMADTAERIGSAVGTAQRQVRRGFELVRRPAIQVGAASTAAAADAAERASQIALEGVDRAARMMEDIEEEVSDVRRQAAHRLDEWSVLAGQRFQQLRRRARLALSHSRARAEELASAYPLQTITAIAGVCFVAGVALRLRRSNRG